MDALVRDVVDSSGMSQQQTADVARFLAKGKKHLPPASVVGGEICASTRTVTRKTILEDKRQATDKHLVGLVQRGDKVAFDMLVIKYQGRVASIISRYVSDHQDIHDVTQETFIKAYRSIGSFRGDSAFYTWLYRIAVNTSKNYLVAKGRRPPSMDVELDDSEFHMTPSSLHSLETPDRILQKNQLEQVIQKSLTELPEELRLAITLRELEGLSYEEIAHILECPVGTVRSRIFRARETLDQVIAPYMLLESSG